MRIALAQINPTVGDLARNSQKIIEFTARAKAQGAQLVVFPELSVTGYPPKDLLLKGQFVSDHLRALDEIAEAGFWRIGLTGHASLTLGEAIGNARVAIVLGAEGEGMRQNTEAHCDELAKLPISAKVESLNVSNAAAIALYAVAAR